MHVEPTDERVIQTEVDVTRFWVFLDRNHEGTDQVAWRDSYRISDATVAEVFAWAAAQELPGGFYRVGVEVPTFGFPSSANDVGVVWLGPNVPLSS